MMHPYSQQKNTEQMLAAIFALDLDPIKFKLMDKKEGKGLTRAEADRLELEYRRFLVLVAKYPDDVIAPNVEVDKFWHGHILDTMKYAQDCEQIFGYFLHHFPYFGMRDGEDAANLADAAANTRLLYQQEFGATQENDAAYCGRVAASEAAYCGRVAGTETAYCGRVAASEAAYCGRATALEAAYCGRVAGAADTAYCGAAADTRQNQILLGKGRPVLA